MNDNQGDTSMSERELIIGFGCQTISPSPWSTQPAPVATLHWLNTHGGLGTGRCKQQ